MMSRVVSLVACLLALVLTTHAEVPDQQLHFAILIDAGSSGSRVHVHPYTVKDSFPEIFPSKSLKIKPGLSSYADDPEAGGRSLLRLMDFARGHLDETVWATVPVYLYATAGLRAIDPVDAENVLDACRQVLHQEPFVFQDDWAKIISGQQEGLNGWIAANYLMGAFSGKDSAELVSANSEPLGLPVGSTGTVGVIEVGGASMQVSFVPSRTHQNQDPDKFVKVHLAGRDYEVYTHSYLNYGLEKAQELFSQTLIKEIEEHGNPCYPIGLRHSAVGDFDKCWDLMSQLLDKTVECASAQCSFNGVSQPHIRSEPFVAIENFFYTTSFFGIEDQHDFSEHLTKHGDDFCALPWSQMTSHYEDEDEDSLTKYCFAAAYLPRVLHHGLGITTPSENVRIAKKIDGTDIDWALGAVFFEVQKMLSPEVAAAPAAQNSLSYAGTAGAQGSNGLYYLALGALIGVGVGVYVYYSRSKPTAARYTKAKFTARV